MLQPAADDSLELAPFDVDAADVVEFDKDTPGLYVGLPCPRLELMREADVPSELAQLHSLSSRPRSRRSRFHFGMLHQ
jgi:hypothetical protein